MATGHHGVAGSRSAYSNSISNIPAAKTLSSAAVAPHILIKNISVHSLHIFMKAAGGWVWLDLLRSRFSYLEDLRRLLEWLRDCQTGFCIGLVCHFKLWNSSVFAEAFKAAFPSNWIVLNICHAVLWSKFGTWQCDNEVAALIWQSSLWRNGVGEDSSRLQLGMIWLRLERDFHH